MGTATSGSATRKNSSSGSNKEIATSQITKTGLTSGAFRNRTGVSAVYSYPTLESTNNTAKELAQNGAPHLSLVITPRQTGGRGRGSNRWWSGAGSLTLSILYRPRRWLSVESLVVGVSIVRALRRLNPRCPVGVKWPNDIYAADMKKVGGILIESVMRRGRVESCVIGIGLNVNAALRRAPADVRARATSLRNMTGRRWDERQVLTAIVSGVIADMERLGRVGFGPFRREWQLYDCVRHGQSVTVEVDHKKEIIGRYAGVSEDGQLRLIDASGAARLIRTGTLIVQSE